MKVAGLFAGVGGVELGLEKAGLTTSLLCEIEPRAQAVLKARFPGVPLQADVSSIAKLPRDIDLLTAGFPCQDLSPAGRTKGIFGRRSGLIRSVFRLISESRPPWVLIENVPFLLRLDRGRGIAYVVRNFERLGYRWAYRVIDTRAFGLPQRRERVFLLASRDTDPSGYLLGDDVPEPEFETDGSLAHGFYWTEGTRGLGWAVDAVPTIKGGSAVGIPSPPAIWFPDGRLATPDVRDAERLQGFPQGWTQPSEAVSRASYRWTLVGNAVSVPVAKWIGEKLLAGSCVHSVSPGLPLPPNTSWPRAAMGGPGARRFAVDVGSFPVLTRRPHLHSFLKFEPQPLSLRAAQGFRGRLQRSTLARPAAFDDALNAYVGCREAR